MAAGRSAERRNGASVTVKLAAFIFPSFIFPSAALVTFQQFDFTPKGALPPLSQKADRCQQQQSTKLKSFVIFVIVDFFMWPLDPAAQAATQRMKQMTRYCKVLSNVA
ncbi:Hypothetical predicted protein [Podarcis lilfordi]|uniref:Uncharacterized protein n=1 Tax=Podarcis lilfordi TaxID=74358 RepID=A0AA35L2C0_9SAUR|nr:Hypothetical predicted protein [Podarcis lilfordi]